MLSIVNILIESLLLSLLKERTLVPNHKQFTQKKKIFVD